MINNGTKASSFRKRVVDAADFGSSGGDILISNPDGVRHTEDNGNLPDVDYREYKKQNITEAINDDITHIINASKIGNGITNAQLAGNISASKLKTGETAPASESVGINISGNAATATNADFATNSENINADGNIAGNPLTDIFVSWGEELSPTVKNAQSAGSATSVTTSIDGRSISDIFESGSNYVKNATNATNATYAQYTDSSHTSKTIEERLTELGFSTGNATSLSGVSSVTLKKLGKFVICKIVRTHSQFSFNIPQRYAPYTTVTSNIYGKSYNSTSHQNVGVSMTVSIDSSGSVSTSSISVPQPVSETLQLGWSIDGNFPI